MNIALDFDNTFTADSQMWADFVDMAHKCGHKVYIVTARNFTDKQYVQNFIELFGVYIPVYCTSLKSKTEYMKQQGIDINIWIDDSPETLVHGY